MKLITQRDIIRGVSARWNAQYARWTEPDKIAIGKALAKLDGETATPAEIAKIIGNSSWTDLPTCDECGKKTVRVAVELGQEPDYESHTAIVCRACITKAMKLVDVPARRDGNA